MPALVVSPSCPLVSSPLIIHVQMTLVMRSLGGKIAGKPYPGAAMNDVLTPQEVAEELRVTCRTVRNLMYRRELAHVRIGGKRNVLRADLDAYIQSKRIPATPTSNMSLSSRPTTGAKEVLRARLIQNGADE